MVDIVRRNNVSIIGEGKQTMMFAHGFGCDQHVWRHFVRAFQDDYQLVIFDYVGAGQSDQSAYSSERYGSLNGYAEDIIEIIEYLDLQDVIFIGHSVSCMVAIKAAIEKPEYFNRLIFVTPSPSYINDRDYVGGMEKEDLEGLFAIMDSNYLGWSETLAPMVMGNSDRPELGDELTANFCATDPDIAKEFARVTFLSDSRNDLENLKIPSLTLQCTEDMLAPIEVGQYIHEKTPNNTLVVLKATGHCPHLSAPEETIAAIEKYLNTSYALY